MGYTMPRRKDIQTMTGNSSPPNSSQRRHLQKIVEISLPNSWEAYRSSWELGFLFHVLHLTKKIRIVPASQVASLLVLPLKVDKIYLGKKDGVNETNHRNTLLSILFGKMFSFIPE